jgi:hypothetical protein
MPLIVDILLLPAPAKGSTCTFLRTIISYFDTANDLSSSTTWARHLSGHNDHGIAYCELFGPCCQCHYLVRLNLMNLSGHYEQDNLLYIIKRSIMSKSMN